MKHFTQVTCIKAHRKKRRNREKKKEDICSSPSPLSHVYNSLHLHTHMPLDFSPHSGVDIVVLGNKNNIFYRYVFMYNSPIHSHIHWHCSYGGRILILALHISLAVSLLCKCFLWTLMCTHQQLSTFAVDCVFKISCKFHTSGPQSGEGRSTWLVLHWYQSVFDDS